MGQYFIFVNKTKKEFIHPHKLASGLKFWEILASPVATRALCFLLRRSNEGGGGDFHGKTFQEKKTEYCGRWAGDSIEIVGDYDESNIYDLCKDPSELASHNKWLLENNRKDEVLTKKDLYKDITDKMLKQYNEFIEIDEYQVDLKSTGWRDTVKGRHNTEAEPAMRPDMIISVKKETA